MNLKSNTILQRLDALVRWTHADDQVRQDMSADFTERPRQLMRWLPLLPMALGAGLIYFAIAAPLPHGVYAVAGPAIALAGSIAMNGPLGKSFVKDNERETALRQDAYFVCLAFLTFANILAGPVLLMSAALQAWPVERIVGVAFALFMSNMACFLSLPTLYASWKLSIQREDIS
ncbi:hypothetical protein [Duganella qianjiadongensis]|uniref:Uncharacterized protein n=1 Tax=Duganella qianjiadongensis TaxID=2692176 RepID=A0ABW9VSL2_9BURK|nr:hypothetical protein [Duganella qianjiadongensis]MYM41462.1 hypothetical protein [Duganella qianjiadongensis]